MPVNYTPVTLKDCAYSQKTTTASTPTLPKDSKNYCCGNSAKLSTEQT